MMTIDIRLDHRLHSQGGCSRRRGPGGASNGSGRLAGQVHSAHALGGPEP
jgi:hypothetical protein